MNTILKYCLGYVTFNHLIVKNSVNMKMILSKYEMAFLRNLNVTLRTNFNTDAYYRFRKPGYPKQEYDAILALDFEASIARIFTTITKQEIIEFPCIWIDTRHNMRTIKTFHRYVRPVLHPNLDPLCTQLTGITTQMLRSEEAFPEVFKDFQKWYTELKESTNATSTVFVTSGDWDLKVMLPDQCKQSEVYLPKYMRHWINVKTSYKEVIGKYPRNLKEMIIMLDLKRYGRLHRGIDDTINIANIIKELASRGHVFSK